MKDHWKNVSTGIFVIAALCLCTALVMFLKPSVGDQQQTLIIRLANIHKINVGTRVLFAGKAVGEVTDIRHIRDARTTQPVDSLGRLFVYELVLKIDSSTHVYSHDDIELHTAGLLGERSISITPRKASLEGTAPHRITPEQPLYADSIDPLQGTLHNVSDMSGKINQLADDELLLELKKGSLALAQLCQHLSSEAYPHIASILGKVDTLMNDINHYGLLFHTHKSWKRGRTQRRAALDTLDSPQEFREFLRHETDLITTSTARLVQMLDKADTACRQELLASPELAQAVDALSHLRHSTASTEPSEPRLNPSHTAPPPK